MINERKHGWMMIAVLLILLPSLVFAGGKQEAAAAAEEAKTTISLLHFMSPTLADANDKAFAASLEDYRQNHPDVVIEDEFIQHDNYELKLKTMVASGDLPDVYYSKPDLFPVLRDNGLILPVTEYVEQPGVKEAYKKGAFGDFTQNGEIWAFPFQLQSNHVVYYNQKIFEEAGVDTFPGTMDGFLEAVRKIREAGYIPLVMGNKGKWLAPSLIYNTMVYRYTGGDWFYRVYNNEGGAFTDEPFVKAAELMKEFVDAGAFNEDMNSIDNNEQRVVYMNGEAAMFIEGSWALGPIIDNAPEDILEATRLAVLPPVEGLEQYANQVAGGAGWGIAINAQIEPEERLDRIISFVKEMYGQEYANEAARNGGFPAMPPELDPSEMHPLQQAYAEIPFEFLPIFDVQFPSNIVDVYYNDMQDLLIGRISPMEFARRVEAAR